MTIDLDTLVTEAIVIHHEEEEAQKQKLLEAKRQKEQANVENVRHLIEEALSEEFRAGVTLRYAHSYNSGHLLTTAYFPYLKYDWHLKWDGHHWTIYTTQQGKPKAYEGEKDSGLTHAELQRVLLVEMGKARENARQYEESQKEYARREAERLEVRRLEKLTEERECKARITEANAIHERLLARITEERKQAEQDLWRWPEGVTVDIYELQYCTGGYRDEDGSLSCDYSTGWTDVAFLDEQGRITLQPKKMYTWDAKAASPRVVQLVMGIHKPLWEVHHYSSIEELPEILREKVTVSFPHIVERHNSDLYEDRLVESESTDYDGNWYTQTIGEVPLPWIQELVDRQDVLGPIRR